MGQQGYIYSYLDPCTSKAKEIYIDTSNGAVPLTYNGQVQSFTNAELQSGAFQTWIDSVNSQNPAGPCSGLGLSQSTSVNVMVAQNSISVITTVMSTLSTMASIQDVAASTSGLADALTSISGGASVQGVIQSDEKVSSNNDNNDNNDNNGNNSTNSNNGNGNNSGGSTSNNSSNQNSSNSQGNQTSNSSTGGSSGNQGTNNTTSSGPTSTNNQSSQSSVGSSSASSSSNSTSDGNNQSQGQNVSDNSSNGGGGGFSTVTGSISSVRTDNSQQSESDSSKSEGASSGGSSSSSTKSKVAAVQKGSLMMNGDLVTIASATGDPSQFKFNAGMISANTKNTFAKGVLVNFTSYVNNTNVTLFVSYRHKKLTSIFANSCMMNFQKDFFDTFSLMESYKYHKITATVGANMTIGNIGTSKFQSLSVLGGVFGSFKVTPKIGLTTMFVTVYSPYVYYYEGLWYQSGILLVPFTAVDYKITKKFKFNLSFSAVQQLNDKPLSYQILTGAKCIL